MNIEKLISKPVKYFGHPNEVVKNEEMSRDQKIKALKNWKQSCEQILDSANEGMTGSEQTNLQDVSIALETLRK